MNTASFSLTAQQRSMTKKSARDARDNNHVPGVLYGHNVDPISIEIPYSDVLRTYRKAGESALIDLSLGSKKYKVLIHKIDLHPVRRTIHHVDLYVVNLKEKTDVHVPLEFIGVSEAVKSKGGMLMREHETLTIRCLPSDIPSHIDVPLESLKDLNDSIFLSDLKLDTKKYEVMGVEEDIVLVTVLAPKKAEESTEVEDMQGTEEVDSVSTE